MCRWSFFPESLDAERRESASSPPQDMVGEAFFKVPRRTGPKIAIWCCSNGCWRDVWRKSFCFQHVFFFSDGLVEKPPTSFFVNHFFHPPLVLFENPLKIWLFGSLCLLVSGTRKWGCVSPRLTHRGGWPIGTPSRWAFGSRSAAAGGIRFHAAGFAFGLAADGITADSGTVVYLQHVTLAKNTNKNVEIWVIFNRIPR